MRAICSTHGKVRILHCSRKTSNEEKYVVKLSMLMAKWSEKTSPFCICFRRSAWDLSRVYLSMTSTL
jgi:hypothetical protein